MQQTILTHVEFEDVLALDARPPDESLDWGQLPGQFGELWRPDGGRSQRLIVFIHGGCWLNDYDIGHSRPLCAALADAGSTVWSIEYRRLGHPGAGWPGTFEDVLRAIEFKRQLDVEADRHLLLGHSAGGQLALWAAAQPGVDIDGVIALAAIIDLETYAQGDSACERAAAELMGGLPAVNPEAYAAASPARLELPPSTLCLHAADDHIVPRAQLDALPAGTRTAVIEGAGHFDFIHPETPAFGRLAAMVSAW